MHDAAADPCGDERRTKWGQRIAVVNWLPQRTAQTRMKMTISKNQALRLKFITESMSRMLNASHRASGHHTESNCAVCATIQQSRGAITDVFDRRGAKRLAFVTDVQGHGANDFRFKTRLSDLSETGAFIESVLLFNEGAIVDLTFKVKSKEIKVKSEVCYSIEHVGAGVRFIELSHEDRKLIAKHVNAS